MQIATTADVVAVEENGYPPRYYVARDGVDMARLEKTDKTTYYPFKGLATYYVIRGRQASSVMRSGATSALPRGRAVA